MKFKFLRIPYLKKNEAVTGIIRIMKISFIFLFIFSFQLLALETKAQDAVIELKTNSMTVGQLINEIEKQTDYLVVYSNREIDAARKVDVQRKSDKVSSYLNEAFAGTDISYDFENNYIVLMKKANRNAATVADMIRSAQQQGKTITGKVVDANGEPIIGATILIKGTSQGTVTDMDGNYTLTNVPEETILQFSYVGMEPQEISVSGKTVINVTMKEATELLEEVVVVGYGVVKKSDLTGSISKLKTEDMENRTIVRPEQALQGKTAGVQVIQTSGAPGKAASIRIRGFSSNTSSDPLYVVDGLRTSDIGAIDPNNIESIEVLKDAASAAIYGALAGNGVVLITTKKGKQGEGKITYDVQLVTNELSRIPKVMNANEYVNYMTEAGFITQNEVNSLWDGKTNTDWTKVAFENSFMQKHNLSFQGGNEKGSYILSLSYLDQDGIVKGNKDSYNRITGMINADYNIKKWLKIGTTNTMEKYEVQSVSENNEYGSLLASVLQMDPLTPAYYTTDNLPDFMKNLLNGGKVLLQDEKGRYYGISQVFEGENVHPLIMRDRTDAPTKGANVLGTIYADFTPIKGFTFTSKLGYRASYASSYSYSQIYYANAVAHNDKISISRTNSNSWYYQWENFANYMKSIDKHNFTLMLGASYSEPYSTNVTASGDEIIKDDPLFRDLNYLTPTATKSVSGGYSDYGRQFSYFGRIVYNYANKYLIQTSLRRDAYDTSILPKENRWGTFPAISAGYTISNEDFFSKEVPVSFLKLRASWGQNGSIGPLGGFAYRAAISSSNSYPFTEDIAYQVASNPTTLDNPELKWETSEQLDFGLDLRAFKDRLSFTVDYFDKKTKGLLVSTVPPYETGVSSVVVNGGNVSNKGFEFEIGWREKVNDFSYSITGNLSTLKNKVTYLDPSISRIDGASFHTNSGITAFEKGYPVWYMRGYQLADIDNETGDPIFVDQLTVDTNGDGKPDTADGIIDDNDKVMLGKGFPDFTYGITLNASYKGLDLTVFGTGAEGNSIFNCLTRIDRPRANRLKIFYDDRWTTSNTDASKPRPNSINEDKYWISNDLVMDGSYFKIKQIQLGYTFPENLIKKLSISNLRIYASFDDWFVFTSYPGFDPEASAGSTNLLGVDKGSYPNSKKAVIGINVAF
jgi:TonB-linked SusC/RagA family outer membrane protein